MEYFWSTSRSTFVRARLRGSTFLSTLATYVPRGSTFWSTLCVCLVTPLSPFHFGLGVRGSLVGILSAPNRNRTNLEGQLPHVAEVCPAPQQEILLIVGGKFAIALFSRTGLLRKNASKITVLTSLCLFGWCLFQGTGSPKLMILDWNFLNDGLLKQN